MNLRRRWRFIVPAAVAALVLLLLAVAQLGPVRARVLALVADRMRTDFGVDLSAARLDYAPLSLSVRLQNVRLAKATTSGTSPAFTPFFEVDEVRIALPWSLLAGRVAIDSVELDRPRLTLVRGEDGSLNLPRTSGELDRVVVGAIRIDNGTAEFVDRLSGYSIEARGLSLAMRPVASGVCAGPLLIPALRVSARDRQPLTASIGGVVRYDGASVSFERLMLAAPEGEVQIDGSVGSIYSRMTADLTYRASLALDRIASWVSLTRHPSGTLAASGRVTGSAVAPQVTVTLSGNGMSWATWRNVSLQRRGNGVARRSDCSFTAALLARWARGGLRNGRLHRNERRATARRVAGRRDRPACRGGRNRGAPSRLGPAGGKGRCGVA